MLIFLRFFSIETGFHQCGHCGTNNPYESNCLHENNNWQNNDLVSSNPRKWGIYDSDLPTPMDMAIYYEDTEDLEDWQQLILSEFEESDDLTRDDKDGYDDALCQLKSHQFSWVKFGVWAFRFKLKRFYKHHHKTWKQFCEKVLHLGHAYVDKKIKAARVMRDLICAGFTVLPQNEYQCRFLTKFWGDELIDNWAMIVDAVEPHLITGELLKARFCSREPKEEKWVKIDSEVWEEFQYKARARGLDPNQIIEDYLEDWEATEDDETTDELDNDQVEDGPIEKLEAWQADLQALIEEKDRADNWFTKLIFWSFTNDRSPPISGFP